MMAVCVKVERPEAAQERSMVEEGRAIMQKRAAKVDEGCNDHQITNGDQITKGDHQITNQ